MAVAVVAFDGTRVNAADSNTNWGHWVGGGAAPPAEAQNAYQNALAVNKKVTATTLTGIDYDPGASPLDMTAAANALWFIKTYVADFGDVNATFGVAVGIGSSNADYYKYNIAGSGAALSRYDEYPPQGGYILTALDPNIAAWRDSTTGTPVLTAVDWYGGQCAMVVGGAKSENFAIDSIDVGTGLTITAGDGASTEGNFTDFVAFDQDTIANRYGCVSGSGNALSAWCLLTIGTASVTEFLDSTSVVTFKDGYHSAGLVGVSVGLSHASSIINVGALLIGEGTIQTLAADDTRPDFTVVGTTGSFDCSSTMRNFRNIEFTSVCDIVNADLECELLTQASSNISDSIIRTNSATSIACLQDPTFGVTTDLHDVDFIQSGVGHAIELNTATTYNMSGLTFTGYGANTTDDAALDVTTTGTVVINITGGDTPTFKTAGTSNVTINNTVNLDITVQDASQTVISGASVSMYTNETDASLRTELMNTTTNGSGLATNTFNYATDTGMILWVRKSTTGTRYKNFSTVGTITNTGFSLTVTLIEDTIAT